VGVSTLWCLGVFRFLGGCAQLVSVASYACAGWERYSSFAFLSLTLFELLRGGLVKDICVVSSILSSCLIFAGQWVA
jgi:hypothetical protein